MKMPPISLCGIMDLNQYVGSMNAKDCIYQNPQIPNPTLAQIPKSKTQLSINRKIAPNKSCDKCYNFRKHKLAITFKWVITFEKHKWAITFQN